MKKITILIAILFAVIFGQAQITANFTWTGAQCSGGTIIFQDASTGNPAIGWSWRVNGAELLTGSPTFSHTFPLVSTPTDFQVSLYVDDGTVPSNITKTVTIYPLPAVTISPTNPTICEGSSVLLTASGGDTYDWGTFGTGATITPTVFVPTTFMVTGTDLHGCINTASTDVSVYLIDTTVVNDEFCETMIYDFYGTNLSAPGTYYHTFTSVITGCDSVIQLNLVANPLYFFSETYSICAGESYLWQGTDYTETGIYTVPYLTVHGCDSIYELELTVNSSYEFVTNQNICQGESFVWRGNTYDVAGTYTDLYSTNSQCDSVYILNLTVNSLPQQVVVLQNPSNGILQSGNSGQISLSTSVVGTKYWVTMGGALFTSEHNGTGSGLNLGTNYPAGSFDVWSRNQNDCELLQGTVNFVENTGTNKIVANVTFGTPASNFPANHVKVVLYRKTTDITNNEVIVFEAEQLLSTNGQAEFNNLQPGDYYLGSFIQYPDNYNVAPHIYYQTAVVHEDAISIPVVAGTVFIASLHHIMLEINNGTNNGGGSVGTQDDKKSLNPLKDMVVILRDMDAEEIIGVSVTDVNGQYAFENIPDNTNIQLFVTSFAHQNWIPYSTLTGSSQTYNINFIVDGNSVYPDGTTGINNIEISSIDFSIYPNPASDILQISSSTEKGVLRIYDINGKLAQTELVFTNSEINISSLSTGTYVVVLTNENGEAGVQKFVKE